MAILTRIADRLARRCLFPALLVGCLALPWQSLVAQRMDVPVGVQVPILLKVLSFDRQLHARARQGVVVGIVMQGGNRASVVARDAAVELLSAPGTAVDGIAVRVISLDLDRQSIADIFTDQVLTHLYITPLRAVDIRELAAAARVARVITMTGVPGHLNQGLSLSVGLRGGRPKILVNVNASRAEGADLSAELLKLAEVVR